MDLFEERRVKPVSRLAIAAVLALGAIASPVVAQKKPAAAPAKGPTLSKEFRAAAQPVQKAMTAKDFAAAKAALPAAQAVATTPDDKYYAGLFTYQIAANTKDTPGTIAGAEAMLASGVTPPDQASQINFLLGRETYFAKDYVKSLAYLNESVRLGNKSPEVLIMAADISFKQKQYAPGLTYAEQGITAQKAAGQPVPQDWYERALSAAYNAKNGPELVKWGGMLVKAFPTSANWRSTLVLYRDSKQMDGQITLDLYRLMRATKAIAGERDYFDYAAIASERGLPGETKAVVDLAIASDAKLATSKNLAELRSAAVPKIAADMASLPASERSAAASPAARPSMGTADAYLSYGQYAKAVPLYRSALTKTGVDPDTVNMRLGIALAMSGDKEGARTALQAVKGARAEIAAFWMVYLDVPATVG
jgi:tetratricopeptide (TPR) repeat protein